ncbi:MAG: ABC transporter permease [Planctomycetes bacterium]|nr:ABC transporter permease [Planctomycetota bacterium]
MRTLDLVATAFRALRSQRRRSVLTLLGVAIGAAAVTALAALGEGANGYVAAQFESMGSNLVAVVPGKAQTSGLPLPFVSANDLTLDDAAALERSVPGLARAAPLSIGNESVEHAGRSRQVLVLGTTSAMAPIRGLALAKGRFLPEGPLDRGAAVAVLGATTARELFPGEEAVGAVVRVGGWRLRVIGVLAARGVHFGADLDDAVFLPVATALAIFDQRSLFRVLLEARSHAAVPVVAESARALLAARHRQDDVTVLTPDSVLASLSGILRVLTLVLTSIAALALGVASLGILNVMLIGVAERRREIGLMKAVGASSVDVQRLFLAEALWLAASGACAGLLAGAALARVAAWAWPAFPSIVPAWAAAGTVASAIVVGAAAGALPARRAMRLDPVAALRGR